MDFIWPPRSCCEIHHNSTRFVHAWLQEAFHFRPIAKIQSLTANVFCPSFGNVKNADTFAQRRQTHFVADKLSQPSLGDFRSRAQTFVNGRSRGVNQRKGEASLDTSPVRPPSLAKVRTDRCNGPAPKGSARSLRPWVCTGWEEAASLPPHGPRAGRMPFARAAGSPPIAGTE